jgi:hypothetical protein
VSSYEHCSESSGSTKSQEMSCPAEQLSVLQKEICSVLLVRYIRERGMAPNHFQTVRFEVSKAMTSHIMYVILVGINGSEERATSTFYL